MGIDRKNYFFLENQANLAQRVPVPSNYFYYRNGDLQQPFQQNVEQQAIPPVSNLPFQIPQQQRSYAQNQPPLLNPRSNATEQQRGQSTLIPPSWFSKRVNLSPTAPTFIQQQPTNNYAQTLQDCGREDQNYFQEGALSFNEINCNAQINYRQEKACSDAFNCIPNAHQETGYDSGNNSNCGYSPEGSRNSSPIMHANNLVENYALMPNNLTMPMSQLALYNVMRLSNSSTTNFCSDTESSIINKSRDSDYYSSQESLNYPLSRRSSLGNSSEGPPSQVSGIGSLPSSIGSTNKCGSNGIVELRSSNVPTDNLKYRKFPYENENQGFCSRSFASNPTIKEEPAKGSTNESLKEFKIGNQIYYQLKVPIFDNQSVRNFEHELTGESPTCPENDSEEPFTYFADNQLPDTSGINSSFLSAVSSLSGLEDLLEKSLNVGSRNPETKQDTKNVNDASADAATSEESDNSEPEDSLLKFLQQAKETGYRARQILWMEEPDANEEELRACYSSYFDMVETCLYLKGLSNFGKDVCKHTNTIAKDLRSSILRNEYQAESKAISDTIKEELYEQGFFNFAESF